jgi:hypothetical protein
MARSTLTPSKGKRTTTSTPQSLIVGEKRRTYVSEDKLAQYRTEIAKGRQSKAIQQVESDPSPWQ